MAIATYPPLPPYYRLYKDYLQNPNSAPKPPPPIEGTYVCYGGSYTTDNALPSLEEQRVRLLYPNGPNVEDEVQGAVKKCKSIHENPPKEGISQNTEAADVETYCQEEVDSRKEDS